MLEDLVWVTMNLEDGNRIAYAGDSCQKACEVAAALVGNTSAGRTGSDIILYGPGDGTTSVMVRQIPRKWVGPATPDKAVAACRSVLGGLSQGGDGFWRGGPWADPSTPEGEGGVVAMLREAVE
jgi:hypothetical protein